MTLPVGNNPRVNTNTSRTNSTNGTNTANTTNNNVDVNVEGSAPIAEGSVEAEYGVSTYEATNTTTLGTGTEVTTNVAGPSINVSGSGNASISTSGIDVSLDLTIDATLAEAGISGTHTFNVMVGDEQIDVTVDLSAEGVIGANGELNLDIHIGTDGQVSVNAGASGFAGAQGSLAGGITVTHEGNEILSGNLELTASAGVSGEAHADFGIENGNLEFDVGAEATVGVGFGVDVSGSVNLGNSANLAMGVIEDIPGDIAEGVGNWFSDTATSIGDFFGL